MRVPKPTLWSLFGKGWSEKCKCAQTTADTMQLAIMIADASANEVVQMPDMNVVSC